jgi:hypothetical protein
VSGRCRGKAPLLAKDARNGAPGRLHVSWGAAGGQQIPPCAVAVAPALLGMTRLSGGALAVAGRAKLASNPTLRTGYRR